MDDAELAALVEASPTQAAIVLGDLQKLAPLYANEATRDAAEATLERWIEQGGALRKGVATAWLSRARAVLGAVARKGGKMAAQGASKAQGAAHAAADGAAHGPAAASSAAGKVHGAASDAAAAVKGAARDAAGAVAGGYRLAERNVGNKGARIGEQVARSPHNPITQRAAQDAGRAASFDMSQRLTPARQSVADIMRGPSPIHAKAVSDAYKHGHGVAMNAAATAGNTMGRRAATFGFRAGAVGAAAGAVAGGVHALSDAQRAERSHAAKVRWHKE